MSLRPVIANGIGKDLSSCIKAAFRNTLIHGFGRFQFGACILIPKAESAIGAHGDQSAVNRMKANFIDSIYVLIASSAAGAMTLKGEIILGIHRIDILYGDATLNAAQGIAFWKLKQDCYNS